MLTTTPSALLLIKAFEGFEPQTYFDSAGIATIGFGTTKFANGDKPEIGDEITEDEAEAELFHYIRQEVEPVMNEHFEDIPLQPNQRDALASFLYNLGGDAEKWPTLKKLIRKQADDTAIADQLLKYRKAGGKVLLGLHRRRIAEALVWMGMAWDRASQLAQSAELTDDWRKFAPTKSVEPQIDPEIFEPEQGAPVKPDMSDPTKDTPMTMEDRQFLSARAAGYEDSYDEFMGHRTIVAARNAIKAPNLDTKRAPKPMEDSKTFSGLSKKESGKEAIQWSTVLTGTAGTVGVVKGLTQNTADTVEAARPLFIGFNINHLIIVGLTLGVLLAGVGTFRMIRGHYMAKDGRAVGVQPKI